MEAKILKIGKKEIDYSWISVGRVEDAKALYNTAFSGGDLSEKDGLGIIVDAVVILIRQDFYFASCIEWFKRLLITRKYILKHLSYTELSDFLEIALEPIVGDKKKALEAQKQIEDVTALMIEKMGIEQFTTSLQKQLLSMDGLSTTSEND